MNLPKLSIAVCGSAGGEQLEEVNERVRILGREIAKRDIILLAGAGHGYPQRAAIACQKIGGFTIGISPATSLEDHKKTHNYPVDGFTSIIYTGFGIKGRNVLLVGTSDAIICVGGGIGTLNEFTIAYDEGKAIGILADSGGLSADMKPISQKAYSKKRHTKIVIEEKNPVKLLEQLLDYIRPK